MIQVLPDIFLPMVLAVLLGVMAGWVRWGWRAHTSSGQDPQELTIDLSAPEPPTSPTSTNDLTISDRIDSKKPPILTPIVSAELVELKVRVAGLDVANTALKTQLDKAVKDQQATRQLLMKAEEQLAAHQVSAGPTTHSEDE